MKLLRSFFSHVPEEIPEVPKEESPDPNADRELGDSYRAARRSLVAVCALGLGWSTAQFTPADLQLDVGGVSMDFGSASVPVIIAASLLYLTARWIFEFAMMPRLVRRWPLAQLDFRFVLAIARFSLLAVAAGALERSIKMIVLLVTLLGVLTVVSFLLSLLLMFLTVPVRMWARSRAQRISAANAVIEGIVWAAAFSICLTMLSIIAVGIGSYYEPLRSAFWGTPPDPIALGLFLTALVGFFLSHWLLRPIIRQVFAERPAYYTERGADGTLRVTFPVREKGPLL